MVRAGGPLQRGLLARGVDRAVRLLALIEATFGTEKLDADLEKARDAIKDAGPVLGHGRASRLVLYTKTPLLLKDLEQQIGREHLDSVLVEAQSQPAAQDAGIPGCAARVAGEKVAADFEAALRAG